MGDAVTRHQTLTRAARSGSTEAPVPTRAAKRAGWLRPGLITGTAFVLTVGASTLVFWYIASTTGLVNLSEGALYLVRSIGLAGLLIGGLGLFVIVSAFRRGALPIADVLAATDRVAAGEYDIEIGEQGPREIRSLTRAFNAMTDQLRRRDEAERLLSAEVARELNASLNGLRQSLETLNTGEEELLQVAFAQAYRLGEIIRDVNTLALIRSRELALTREATDLGVLVHDTISGLHRDASARGVALRAALPEPSPVYELDRTHFGQILQCLLVNAMARSAAGEEIQVDLTELPKPTRVQVTVTDHGSEVPPAELPLLFERLSHGDGIGTGFELVIAKQLVQLQGGDVVATSDRERGTTVTLVLPLESPHN
jgi:two-component system sensor histidine kinase BaeS